MAKEWSLGNLDMRESEPQLSLQKSTVSPEAIEHDASLLNLAQSLTMSFHQKELETLVAMKANGCYDLQVLKWLL
jgi:hypothetical protein